MEQAKAEDLVRRIATAVRGADLYSPTHPLVQRGIDNLVASTPGSAPALGEHRRRLHRRRNRGRRRCRLPRGTAALVGFARDLRDRDIEKITITRGITREEIRSFVAVLGDRKTPVPLPDQLAARGVRHITLGPGRRRRRQRRSGGHRRGAARLCRRRPDGGNAVGVGEGGRAAGPGHRAQDHRQPGAAGDPGSHVADGADRAEEVRQLHVHAHGERRGAGDGAGAVAEPRWRAAPRVRVCRADARHRQGQHAARGAEQARTS